MKTSYLFVTASLLFSLAITTGLSQGPLNPPGPPGPTMKTLDQVEARTAITDIPFTITSPGSYFLTASLTGTAGQNGITISSDDVTLDLNGFSLIGVPGSFQGIAPAGTPSNLLIRNGTVRDWGRHGVFLFNASNCQLIGLRASANGFLAAGLDGLYVGEGGLIEGCSAEGNNDAGITAGAGSTVRNCTSYKNGGCGISVTAGCAVQQCTVRDNDGNGILAQSGSSVEGCTASANASDGIEVTEDCRVNGNTCDGNGPGGNDGAGILASASNNRITSNHVTDNDRGLDVDGTGNYVADNTVVENTDNYDFVAGNLLNLLLCEIPESIDWPANVRLAGTLSMDGVLHPSQNGITITSDDVAVDLSGHTLIGATNSLDGIFSNQGGPFSVGPTGVKIKDGTIRDWPMDAIDLGSNSAFCAISNVIIPTDNSGSSFSLRGVSIGQISTISDCIIICGTPIEADVGLTIFNNSLLPQGGGGVAIKVDTSLLRGNLINGSILGSGNVLFDNTP
jgi:parallel beta-helix repeat protein